MLKVAANYISACSALVAKLAKCSAASKNHAPSGEPWTVFDTPTLVRSQVTVNVPSSWVLLRSWSQCFPKLAALICLWGTWSSSVGVGLHAWRSVFPILRDARGGEVGLLQAEPHASALSVFRFAQFRWSYLGHLGFRLRLTLVSRRLGEAGSETLGHLKLPEEHLVQKSYPGLHVIGQALVLGVPCCDLLHMGCFELVSSPALGYVEELLCASNPRWCSRLPTW